MWHDCKLDKRELFKVVLHEIASDVDLRRWIEVMIIKW